MEKQARINLNELMKEDELTELRAALQALNCDSQLDPQVVIFTEGLIAEIENKEGDSH